MPFEEVTEVELICEIDKQWSFIENKQNQRWLWYAWSPHFKTVFAYALGRRTDNTLKKLLKLMEPFTFRLFCADDWGAYQRLLPKEKHLIAKKYTQSIERQNLNFRTHIKRLTRRTICFSKLEEVHDKVIGEYINRHFFQPM